MNKHMLKTWPIYFKEIEAGNKTFEVRRDDRNFQVGDILILLEWDPKTKEYTGNENRHEITYKLKGGQFGIDNDFCCLSIKKIDEEI